MPTGDFYNNLEKVNAALRLTKVSPDLIDMDCLIGGKPEGYISLIHYIFMDDSIHVARFLSEQGYQLYPTNRKHFVDTVFKIMRRVFYYRPALTAEQFLSDGYTERKLIFLCDLTRLYDRKANELERAYHVPKKGNICSSPRSRIELDSAGPHWRNAELDSRHKPSLESKSFRLQDQKDHLRRASFESTQAVLNGSSAHRFAVDSSRAIDERCQKSKTLQDNNDKKPIIGSKAINNDWECSLPKSLETNGVNSSNEAGYGDSLGTLGSPISSVPLGSTSPVSISSSMSAPPRIGSCRSRFRLGRKNGNLPGSATSSVRLANNSSANSLQSANFSDSELQAAVSNRAMDYWVSSPPCPLKAKKKFNAASNMDMLPMQIKLSSHSNPLSPRIQVQSSSIPGKPSMNASMKGRRVAKPRSLGYAIVHHSTGLTSNRRDVNDKNAEAAPATGTSTDLNENKLLNDEQRMENAKVNYSNIASSSVENNDSASDHLIISCPETTGEDSKVLNTTPIKNGYRKNLSTDESESEASDGLTEQLSKIAASIESVTLLSQRIEDMEKNMMNAIRVLDKRVSQLDMQFQARSAQRTFETQQSFSIPKSKATPIKGRTLQSDVDYSKGEIPSALQNNSAGLPRMENRRRNSSPCLVTNVSMPAIADDTINTFVKGIEMRFMESEAILARSKS